MAEEYGIGGFTIQLMTSNRPAKHDDTDEYKQAWVDDCEKKLADLQKQVLGLGSQLNLPEGYWLRLA